LKKHLSEIEKRQKKKKKDAKENRGDLKKEGNEKGLLEAGNAQREGQKN